MRIWFFVVICAFVLVDVTAKPKGKQSKWHKPKPFKGKGKQCVPDDLTDFQGMTQYRRTFVMESRAHGSTTLRPEPWHKRWMEYNTVLGRGNRAAIIAFGRKKLQWMKNNHGIAFNGVTDDDLYYGNRVVDGKFAWAGFILDTEPDGYGLRLIFESAGRNSKMYEHPPFVYHGGYMVSALDDVQLNGIFPHVFKKGYFFAPSDFYIKTGSCGLEYEIKFDVVADQPIADVVDCNLYSTKYGEGVIIGPWGRVTRATFESKIIGRFIVTFPPILPF